MVLVTIDVVQTDRTTMFVCLSVCVSVCMSVCVSVCMSVCVSVCLSACLSLFVCLSVRLPVRLCVRLSISLFVCLLFVWTSVCTSVCTFVLESETFYPIYFYFFAFFSRGLVGSSIVNLSGCQLIDWLKGEVIASRTHSLLLQYTPWHTWYFHTYYLILLLLLLS